MHEVLKLGFSMRNDPTFDSLLHDNCWVRDEQAENQRMREEIKKRENDMVQRKSAPSFINHLLHL